MMHRATSQTLLIPTAWAAVAAALALMVVRSVNAVSLSEPLLTMTSGAEFETAFALWKYVHGHDVYTSPYRIPFAASYYGWLFYWLYGEIIGLVLRGFSLADAWLPTVARPISLLLTGLGALFCWQLLRHIARDQPSIRALILPLTLTFFFGPLVGYWAISLNCEIGATTLTVAGALVVVRYYDRSPTLSIAAASILSVGAWSFKQSYVYLAVAIGLFLLLRRDIRSLVALIVIHAVALAGVVVFGSEAFHRLFFLQDQALTFAFWQLVRNLVNLAIKTTPQLALLVPLAALALMAPSQWRRLADDTALTLSTCGFLATAVLTLAASAKVAAAENYYFPLVFFLIVAGVSAAGSLARQSTLPAVFAPVMTGGFFLHLAACLAVLMGLSGVTSVRDWHDRYSAHRACLQGRPSPVLVDDVVSNLPWISGSAAPHFILASLYMDDRKRGYSFEAGGVAGLIKSGYFSTIAIHINNGPMFDGENVLNVYEVAVPDCGGLTIYSRRR